MPNRPPRLERIWSEPTLFFLTFNTAARAKILACDAVHERFLEFARRARIHRATVGRFVIMPDHIHLFVAGSGPFELSGWVRSLKLSLSSVLSPPRPHWQAGFFDHLLRSSESYEAKWRYVRENPVRAGLVEHADEWPFQGEVEVITGW